MNGDLIVFAVILIAFCLGAVVVKGQESRTGTPVERWARANGFTIVSQERMMFVHTRILGVAKSRETHRIVIRDLDGRTRSGVLEREGLQCNVRWDV